jgi:exonuclease SbcC
VRRTITFPDSGLFVVVGDTGAGKTSVLEAMTYALFNRPTWKGREVKALISDGADFMSVEFTFAVGGLTYEVTRLTSAANAAPVARFTCRDLGLDVSGSGAVDKAVSQALGMDDATFLATVLLPQGRHADLLTATSGDRIKILQDLFRLDDLKLVDEFAKEQIDRSVGALRISRDRRARLAPDPTAVLELALADLTEKTERVAACEHACDEDARLVEGLAVTDAALSAERAAESLVKTAAENLGKLMDLRPLEREHRSGMDHVESLLAIALAQEATLRRDLEALAADGRDAPAMRSTRQAFDALLRALTESSAAERRANESAADLKLIEVALEASCAEERSAKAACETAREVLSAAEAEKLRREEMLAALSSAIERRDDAVAKEHAARENCRVTSEEAEAAAESYAAAERGRSDARSHVDDARRAYELAFISDAGASLASRLQIGDSCPVCARELGADFAAPPAPDVTGALKLRDDAERLAREVDQRYAEAISRRDVMARRAIEAKDLHASRVTETQSAEASLLALVADGVDVRTAFGVASAAADESRGFALASAWALEAATSNESLAGKNLAACESSRASIDKSHAANVSDRDARRRTVAVALQAVPVSFRFSPLEAEAGESLRLTIESDLTRAERAQREFEAVRERIRTLQEERRSHETRLAEAVTVPRSVIIGALASAARHLVVTAAPDDAADVVRWSGALDVAVKAERARVVNALAEHDAERVSLVASRASLATVWGGAPQTMRERILLEKAEAERGVDDARRVLAEVAEFEQRIGAIEPVKAGLEELRGALVAGGFPRYAIERRQRRLLEKASEILGGMMDGRYELTGDFRILDRSTNEVRAPVTLSGGEKFLASLALSLAVVEIAMNAGARIESLFLDEGFDSLDASMLPIAMMELKKHANGGRLIGVITHVAEAARFASSAYVVERRADGSTFEKLDDSLDEDESTALGLVTHLVGGAT